MEAAVIPEQGQLVEVRRRQYVVTEVTQSALPQDALGSLDAAPQHLISLASIEDDALGEELRVIWELEPGATVREQSTLPEPTGFDAPARLDAFLDAVRWGAVSSADWRTLLAPFRSGIELEDYQLDPLVRAVQMPRVNLLIADDVGLGKTIEAGLVVQELIVRNRARSVLVVCPAALQVQWRDQMRDKFGLEFRLVDSDLMKQLRRQRGLHTNPWTHFPRLITSIDFLKRDRPMRLMREVLPAKGEAAYPRRFDLLIVDEAHNVAPPGAGKYAIDSQRTAAIRALAPHFEHKLFLTATPHNGYSESFTALLELLDNQRFARGVAPDKAQLGAVMVRRLKAELKGWDGSPRFPQRVLDPIEVDYSSEERQVHRWLREYTQRRQQGVTDAQERYAGEFVLKLLKKRLFSSPAAYGITLAQHERTLTQARKRGAQPAHRPGLSVLRQQVERVEEDYADDEAYEDSAADAVDAASRLFRALTPEERELLTKMQQWAESASGGRDSKTQELLDWLEREIRPGGVWSDERVIIFTEYRATQNWLQTILASRGFTSDPAERGASSGRLMTLYGGMDGDQREQVKAAFQAGPEVSPVRILLATDAASEGIDLQNHCHRLIHFEIPWNPNRMEQRNGRVDRHGQRHQVRIYHFVAKGFQDATRQPVDRDELEADLEFLMRAAEKVEQIREDLGKVGPVIAQQVEEAMLGRRTRLDTSTAERDSEPTRRLLKLERDLRDQVQKHYAQLLESRQTLHMAPENVQAVVTVGLQLAAQPPLRPATVPGLPDGVAYHLPALSGSWALGAEGLAHPHTGETRPIVFDHDLAKERDDVVLAHLNHRLVQMALRLLRAEIWALNGQGTGNQERLHRVTARLVPNNVLETPAAIAYARLVVTGGDSHRLHEEIITAGGAIREGRFRRMNVGEVAKALDAALPEPASGAVSQRLAELWPVVQPGLLAALEARMKERAEGVGKLLEERAHRERVDIQVVMRQLQKTIEQELGRPESLQLELPGFSDAERDQLRADLDALRRRLAQIPGELERETAAITERYANPTPRLFPVAVTFLVPERLRT
ncbi:MAG: DEAD/DEAH box helicase [Anaerolineales bacterium]|nr:DEAD/DEAH box helicase [Anaerolineales bacterium]